jgi:DNA modification methylase
MMIAPYYEEPGITIYHGDCRDVLPALPKVDLVLTDPPYGISADKAAHERSGVVVGHGHRRVAKRVYEATDWDAAQPSPELLRAIIAAGSRAIIFGGNYFGLPAAAKWLVWDKMNDGTQFADCELAWTNLDGAARLKRHLWNGMAREVLEIRYDHPTQKPLGVISWCLSLVPAAQSVLDPFMGSGTTLVAAKRLGRRAIGIEIEERYCEIAARRVQEASMPLFDDQPVAEQMALIL